jgi:hypothetical protein
MIRSVTEQWVRFRRAQGVTQWLWKRTFLITVAAIASGKKVRFRDPETMGNETRPAAGDPPNTIRQNLWCRPLVASTGLSQYAKHYLCHIISHIQ